MCEFCVTFILATKSQLLHITVRNVWPQNTVYIIIGSEGNDVKMKLSQCAVYLDYWRIYIIPPPPPPKLLECKIHVNSNAVEPTEHHLMLQKIKRCELHLSAKPYVYFFPLRSFCWTISHENETQDKSTSAVSGRTNRPMCYSMIRSSVSPRDLIFAVPKSVTEKP